MIQIQTIAAVRLRLALSWCHQSARPDTRSERAWQAGQRARVTPDTRRPPYICSDRSSSAKLGHEGCARTRSPARRATTKHKNNMAAVPPTPTASPCHTVRLRPAGRSRLHVPVITQHMLHTPSRLRLSFPLSRFQNIHGRRIYGEPRRTHCAEYLRDTNEQGAGLG